MGFGLVFFSFCSGLLPFLLFFWSGRYKHGHVRLDGGGGSLANQPNKKTSNETNETNASRQYVCMCRREERKKEKRKEKRGLRSHLCVQNYNNKPRLNGPCCSLLTHASTKLDKLLCFPFRFFSRESEKLASEEKSDIREILKRRKRVLGLLRRRHSGTTTTETHV